MMPEKKKNWIKRNPWKSALIVVVIVIVLWIWKPWVAKTPPLQEFFNTDVIVGTGNLETVLTIQGSTQFSDSQRLTFMNKGKVKTVNVKVGDVVTKGQVLATITTDDLDDNIEQARINLDDAQQALQDVLDGYNLELELLQEEANYKSLILKQQTIGQDHLLALEALHQQIEDARKTYEDTKTDYEELLSGSNSATADLALSSIIRQRNTVFQNAVLDLKNVVTTVQSALDVFDQKLVLTTKYGSRTKNIYIGAKDPNLKNQAESLFWTISNQLSELDTLQRQLEAIAVADLTNEQILEAYTLVKDIGSNLVTWGDVSYTMFKESIDNTSYTLAQITSDADSALKNQTTGIGYIQKYSSIVDSLANLKEDTSLEDTKLKMDKAKTNLDKLELQVNVLLADQEKEKASLIDQIDKVQRNIRKIQ